MAEKLKKDNKFYLSNSELLPEVIKCKEAGKISNRLAEMFMLLVERYSRKPNFIRYPYREDMKSAALLNLCINGLKFNAEKSSNPFAYYTTAIHRSFIQYIGDEKTEHNIKNDLLVEAGENPSFDYNDDFYEKQERFYNGSDEVDHDEHLKREFKVTNPDEEVVDDVQQQPASDAPKRKFPFFKHPGKTQQPKAEEQKKEPKKKKKPAPDESLLKY